MTRTVIVFGLSGRIGSMLLAYSDIARGLGLQITGVSRMLSQGETGGVDWVQWPTPDQLPDLLRGADVVVNLAGATPTSGLTLNESALEAANVTLASQIAQAARDASVRRLLMASSAAVYGANSATPLDEGQTPQPQSPYARSKLRMEELAPQIEEVETCCLRITTVAGADMLLQNAHAAARDGATQALHQFPSGEGPKRSYIAPSELARQIFALCATQHALPPVLNLTSPGHIRMQDLLNAYNEFVEPLSWAFTPAPATAIETVELSAARLAEVLGDLGPRPLPPMEDLMKEAKTFIDDTERTRHA